MFNLKFVNGKLSIKVYTSQVKKFLNGRWIHVNYFYNTLTTPADDINIESANNRVLYYCDLKE